MKKYMFEKSDFIYLPKSAYLPAGVVGLCADIHEALQELLQKSKNHKFINYKSNRFKITKLELKAAKFLLPCRIFGHNNREYTVCISGSWIKVQFVYNTPSWAMNAIKKFLEKNNMVYHDKPYKWSRPIGLTNKNPYIALGPRTVNFTGFGYNQYTQLGLMSKN